jgi:formamidopyrimidine-DNA glycosylase
VPELPEVETERGRLAPALAGRLLERVEILDARLVRPLDPPEVAAELTGERVTAVERRGKYLLVRFESGRALLVHLRMTGGFRFEPASHERAVLTLDDGTRVAYRDVRRFGTWQLFESGEVGAHLEVRAGPEPLGPGFTRAFLMNRLQGRRAPVKAAILDQRTVAGLGNIYADETLWHARVNPLRPAGDLGEDEVAALRRGVRRALRRGIELQGADLGDSVYSSGTMQHEFKVYGRGGEPCDRCGTPIAKTRVAGRGTWYCPTCQAASNSSSRPSRSRRQSSV